MEITGKIGKCQYYDGSNDYIDIPELVGSGKPFTVEMWFYITETNEINDEIQMLIDLRHEKKQWMDFVRDSEIGNDMALHGRSYRNVADTGGNSIQYKQWYYSVMVVDDVSDTFSIYLNGQLKDTAQNDIVDLSLTTNRLGSCSPGLSHPGYLYGMIDEVKFSSIARSNEWIQTEYNNQNNPGNFHTFGPEETN